MINVGINGFDQLGCEITTIHPMVNYQYTPTLLNPPALPIEAMIISTTNVLVPRPKAGVLRDHVRSPITAQFDQKAHNFQN